jgi:hypothetical protein
MCDREYQIKFLRRQYIYLHIFASDDQKLI